MSDRGQPAAHAAADYKGWRIVIKSKYSVDSDMHESVALIGKPGDPLELVPAAPAADQIEREAMAMAVLVAQRHIDSLP